jgi:hypothetical protein
VAPPTVPSSADLFVAFSNDSQQVGDFGTAFIFSDGLFSFDALDLNFTSSDSSVLLLTDGETSNPTFETVGGRKFDSSVITIDPSGSSGNLFSVSVTENGVNPALGQLFDPGFDIDVGPNGAVLLAEIAYELVGEGMASIELSLGTQGILQFPDSVLSPSLGSTSLTVGSTSVIPEPSSAALLGTGFCLADCSTTQVSLKTPRCKSALGGNANSNS